MTDDQQFFIEEVSAKLKELKGDERPKWGAMTVAEMLAHLTIGIKMSLENIDGAITTPEEKLPALKAFLMSDKPFGQGLPQPDYFSRNVAANELDDIEHLKVQLMKHVVEMYCYFARYQDHTAVHPSFGRLGTEEWKQLHKKHITHHFTQFGLIGS